MLEVSQTEYICADKGYDSDKLHHQIEKIGAHANISKKKNTKSNNNYMNWYLYKMRYLVENAFARLKHFRGTATRIDKRKQSFKATVALACAYIWVKL